MPSLRKGAVDWQHRRVAGRTDDGAKTGCWRVILPRRYLCGKTAAVRLFDGAAFARLNDEQDRQTLVNLNLCYRRTGVRQACMDGVRSTPFYFFLTVPGQGSPGMR